MHVRPTADPDDQPLPCLAAGDAPPVLIPVVSNVVSVSVCTNLREANQNTLPFSPSFTSFDAIICTIEEILLIQCTISRKYDLKRAGLQFIRQNIPVTFWKERRCYVVFVTPNESHANSLCSAIYPALDDFPEVNVLSCVFPIGTSTFTALHLEEVQEVGVKFPSLEAQLLIGLNSTARLLWMKTKRKTKRKTERKTETKIKSETETEMEMEMKTKMTLKVPKQVSVLTLDVDSANYKSRFSVG